MASEEGRREGVRRCSRSVMQGRGLVVEGFVIETKDFEPNLPWGQENQQSFFWRTENPGKQ